jgi:hypothetical protein
MIIELAEKVARRYYEHYVSIAEQLHHAMEATPQPSWDELPEIERTLRRSAAVKMLADIGIHDEVKGKG